MIVTWIRACVNILVVSMLMIMVIWVAMARLRTFSGTFIGYFTTMMMQIMPMISVCELRSTFLRHSSPMDGIVQFLHQLVM